MSLCLPQGQRTLGLYLFLLAIIDSVDMPLVNGDLG